MSFTVVPYTTYTNEDFVDGFMVEDDDGPVDLTGSAFVVHIRQSTDSLSVVLEASTANGLLVIADQSEPDETGLVEFAVPSTVSSQVHPGSYPFDILWIMPGGERDNIGGGTITFKRGVTRIP